MVLQFTGLSGAGKTTLANGVKALLSHLPIAIIDGDVYRHTLCKDLGFSNADRCENIRRLGKVAGEMSAAGQIAIIAAINPYESVRQELATAYDAKTVWVQCTIDMLTQRDTKGLYQRAALPEGHPDKLHNLTGVNDTYEAPLQPHLVINTTTITVETAIQQLAILLLRNSSNC